MSERWRSAIVVALLVLGIATSAQAIGLVGNYHESSGVVLNIPLNPPVVPCDASADNARCHFKQQKFWGQVGLARTEAPAIGVPGATSIAGDPRSVGAPFTLPTGFMHQDRTQATPVLGAVAIYRATSFDAIAPAAERDKHLGLTGMDPGFVPNPNTRVFAPRTFSTANLSAFGQNNGLATTDPDYRYRRALDTTYTASVPFTSRPVRSGWITVTYRGGSGFSGTAGLLLDGSGDVYLGGPNIDVFGTPAQAPVLLRYPTGDDVSGNPELRAGMGWDYIVTAVQDAGALKTFGLGTHDPLPGGFCTTTAAPALPAGCNVVVGFDTNGGPGPFQPPGVTTVRHAFPWTTGTVTVTVVSRWDSFVNTVTVRGRGHDATSPFATGQRRSLGLVAGGYAARKDPAGGSTGIYPVLAGMNLVFTPEPSSTIALLVGVGLLGALAARRGRSIRGD
ncbi:MAG: PEP-CTERM sorting domain-containing protein [bacterium]|nr:PEP-CTERM sorting domain-containing protein [bacterium]